MPLFITPCCHYERISNGHKTNAGVEIHFHPLPNDKILDVTKLKAFAGDELNVA